MADIKELNGTAAETDSQTHSEEAFAVPRKPVYCFFKRCLDIVFSVLAIALLLLPAMVICLIIVIDSPGGSPFYIQKRVGKNGKVFRFYKFRSMVPNAEKQFEDLLERNEMDGPVFKIKKDPRITRFGSFIRRTSIDELPQLVNILKGDMSFVGPRPPMLREVEQYKPHQMFRLLVTPGLTCYWQIQPKRNSLSFDRWCELDKKYIQERCFLVDLKILFKTVGAVMGMEGE